MLLRPNFLVQRIAQQARRYFVRRTESQADIHENVLQFGREVANRGEAFEVNEPHVRQHELTVLMTK